MVGSPLIWPFGQPWLSQPESSLAPGRVSVGAFKNELRIRAELTDVHPMQDVYELNFPAFTKCDAFEIFLCPADEAAYYEFHVTPSNSVFQLHFDGKEAGKSPKGRAVAAPFFSSKTTLASEGWMLLKSLHK